MSLTFKVASSTTSTTVSSMTLHWGVSETWTVGGDTFSVSKPKPASAKPAEKPKMGKIQRGPARAVLEGFLYNREGTVVGFTEAGGSRLCLVEWPEGGRTFVAENGLRQPPGAPERKRP